MKSFLIFSCLLAVAIASPTATHWHKWKLQHGRSYEPQVERIRQAIFEDNLAKIEAHNAKAAAKHKSYTLKLNKFADLAGHEFSYLMKGLRFNSSERVLKGSKVNAFEDFSLHELPQSVDWREKNLVNPVKDQAQCGSCWAFSTVAAIEGQHALATGKLVSLSEQQLVDCSKSYGNNGCNGGLMDNGFQYVIDNKGIDTEKSYPYTARDNRCHFKRRNVGATIDSFVDVQSGNETALQIAVATIGPISVAIDASAYDFQFYHEGVYNSEDCSSTMLDHGVAVVGYGSQDNSDYWIVRNSWGEDWGNQGYIWMSRNKDNQCGIATAASYPIINSQK